MSGDLIFTLLLICLGAITLGLTAILLASIYAIIKDMFN